MSKASTPLNGEDQPASPALFLDRDGTLIEHIPYLHDPAQVRPFPGIREALQDAQNAGFLLFILTNQSGVGRGYFTIEEAEACNQRLVDILQLPKPFAAIKIAPEHPDEPPCYRKPSPRFIEEMIVLHKLDPAHCYMIGDSQVDIDTARNAQIHPVAIAADAASGVARFHAEGIPTFSHTAAAIRAILQGRH